MFFITKFFMRNFTFLLTLLISSNCYSQLTNAERREFCDQMNYRVRIDQFVSVTVYEFMHLTYPNHTPLQLDADIEGLGNTSIMFDKFCYTIVLQNNGNRELSGQVLKALCGSASWALNICDYISSKFRDRLAGDIAQKKIEAKEYNEAQQRHDTEPAKSNNFLKKDSNKLDTAFAVFPGGDAAWQQFLYKNFKYPDEAVKNDIQGTVIVEFIVDTLGNPRNIRVISGPETLGKAAVDVISRTTWIPASVGERKVQSVKKQPIIFKLQD